MVDPKKDAEKSVDEVFDAEPVELGGGLTFLRRDRLISPSTT